MDIVFTGQYNKHILYKALILINKTSLVSRILRISLLLVFLGIYTFLSITVYQDQSRSYYDVGRLTRHFFTLVGLIYYAFYEYFNSYIMASRMWNFKEYHNPISGTISNQGVIITSTGTEQSTPWEKFSKAGYSPALVILTSPGKNPYVFPRSFFENTKDWENFLKMAKFKILEAK